MKKSTALLLILILFLCGIFLSAFPEDSLLGRWETSSGLSLEITEHHMLLHGISFPYQARKDHTIVLDGGRLGPILGSYHFKGNLLHLTIHGVEKIFYRA